ncbi:hypothetical protein BH09ACT7_BH09ACT7_37500 [soil metagenome]
MSALMVEFDRAERIFSLQCSCGWHGSTADLYRAAAPAMEHLKACLGTPPRSQEPYCPDTWLERSSRTGLTDSNKAEIRSLAAGGELQRVIAERFGISQGLVSSIVRSR